MKENHIGEAAGYIQRINLYSKELVERISDIVWATNPSNDTIEKLVSKIKSYAIPTAASKNISIHFDIKDILLQQELNMKQRKNIFLISKEAINNSFKYADCSNIYYKVEKHITSLCFIISDDGKGFDTTSSVAGNGLVNMQHRVHEIEANLTVSSLINNGTVMQFRLPGFFKE